MWPITSRRRPTAIPAIKNYFKAYATNDQVRHIIESKQYTDLATNPVFSTSDFKAVPEKYRTLDSRIHQGLRLLESVRRLEDFLCSIPTPNAASTPPATFSSARSPTPSPRSSRSPSP